MSVQSGGIIIDWRQAMRPDSPAVKLEAVGSPSPSVAPCPAPAPAAAAHADAGTDRGGCAGEEFSHLTDRELQDRIRKWEGLLRAVLRTAPDGGQKMQSQVLRMKEKLERRMVRQRKDDTVLRQAVQAKRSTGEFSHLTDRDLQDRIRRCEGPLQAVIRAAPDGGQKVQSKVLRMKEELERRMARQRK